MGMCSFAGKGKKRKQKRCKGGKGFPGGGILKDSHLEGVQTLPLHLTRPPASEKLRLEQGGVAPSPFSRHVLRQVRPGWPGRGPGDLAESYHLLFPAGQDAQPSPSTAA